MPLYTIAPSSRRSMHYNPFSPVLFGGHGYGPRRSSPCAPPRSSASLVPSLFKDLESDFSSSLDSFFNDILSSPHQQAPAIRSFQPRFDVREEADAFHLTGDLPGVEAGNIAVEFTNRDTMVVKGQTVRETRQGNASTTLTAENGKAVEGTTDAEATTTPAAANTEVEAMETEPTTDTPPSRTATPDSTASNYHKATVEDDADDFVDVAAENTGNEDNATATTATADATPVADTKATASFSENANAQQQQQVQQPLKPTTTAEAEQGKYWVSERSVGSFSRTFRFPAGSADRDHVSASLKDGVLKVVVPKNKEQGLRRIRVE